LAATSHLFPLFARATIWRGITIFFGCLRAAGSFTAKKAKKWAKMAQTNAEFTH
jgi:hypothetical protein